MAEDGYLRIIVGFLLFGLFATLILLAIQGMGVNYGVSSEKMEEATQGALDIDDYEQELLVSDDTTSNFRERFESGDTTDVDDASGIFSVAGDIIGVVTTPYTLIAEVGENLIGIPPIVSHVLLGILNLMLILGIWRVLRIGS